MTGANFSAYRFDEYGLLAKCDDRTKEKNVIRKSPSICTTLARREYWGAVDLLSTKTDQTIQQHSSSVCSF